MKHIILLGDGMSDYPIDEIGGKTPLEFANTPNMDFLADNGLFGRVQTVPEGYPPGSDVANLSVFGYNVAKYYTGRAPLEAASMGVRLGADNVACRCNLVTLDDRGAETIMDDFSAGHITTEEAAQLIQLLQDALGGEDFQFHPGVSYRHLLVWKNGQANVDTTPPHDISDKAIAPHLPKGAESEKLIALMEESKRILAKASVNKERIKQGKKPATSIWLWGQGKAPSMPDYQDKYGLSGSVISAVDLVKGLGVYAGCENIDVPGATGYLDTNFRGKADYALKALETTDFVYLHVEAPDEAGHSGNLKDKITAIENFDAKVVGPVIEGIKKFDSYRILLLPDHATPLCIKTHSSDPVPFALYPPVDTKSVSSKNGYNEKAAGLSPVFFNSGEELTGLFLS